MIEKVSTNRRREIRVSEDTAKGWARSLIAFLTDQERARHVATASHPLLARYRSDPV